MIIPHSFPAILILLVFAGASSWPWRRVSGRDPDLTSALALAALGIASVALVFSRSLLDWAGLVTIEPVRVARFQAVLFLLAMGLDLAITLVGRDSKTGGEPRDRLLAAAAGLVALSSQSLLTLLLAVLLYAIIWPSEEPADSAHDRYHTALGCGTLFFGAALVYARTGAWFSGGISDLLWLLTGPGHPALVLGMALILVGVSLVAGLVRFSGNQDPARPPTSLLGVAIILRLLTEWFGGLHIQAASVLGLLAAITLGSSLASFSKPNNSSSQTAMTRFRLGFIFFALALAWRSEGLIALVALQIEYLLAVWASAPYVTFVDASASEGKRSSSLVQVIPGLLACLSGACVLGTLGFAARVNLMFGLAASGSWTWLLAGGVLVLWGAFLGLGQGLPWLLHPTSRPGISSGRASLVLASGAAFLLLFLGLFSAQLVEFLGGLLPTL